MKISKLTQDGVVEDIREIAGDAMPAGLYADGYREHMEEPEPELTPDEVEGYKMYVPAATRYDAESDTNRRGWEMVNDVTKVMYLISRSKRQLAASDYKVVKMTEWMLTGAGTMAAGADEEAGSEGEMPPYDMAELHAGRQAIRDEINRLERLLEK